MEEAEEKEEEEEKDERSIVEDFSRVEGNRLGFENGRNF